ncbi:MAG: hypothetical protein KME31_11930 [Tolypothrix carrinoi HA7290-LM1]|nr:hypothetical protein [Tolypothrix carrinoi HA7290-LM1]
MGNGLFEEGKRGKGKGERIITNAHLDDAPCPMTADAPRRSDTKTALPPPCPMPYAPCPMPHALCPMPYAPCPMPHAPPSTIHYPLSTIYYHYEK